MQATDLEHSLEYELGDVSVADPGVLCLPAKRLGEIFRLLPSGAVSVESNDQGGVTIKRGGSVYHINGTDPADFPQLPVFDAGEAFALPAAAFKGMVEQVNFAVAREKMRYSLHGVLLEAKEAALTLVGSDGQRMAVSTRKVDIGRNYPPNIIVRKQGLDHLDRILGDEDEEIQLQVRENQILVKTARAVVSTRLLDGLYPDYSKVIPDGEGAQKAVIDRIEWTANLKRARILVSEKTQTVRLHFGTNVLTITSQDPDAGESSHEMPIDYTGDAIEIGFDPVYLLDVLAILDSPEVVFELQGPDAAGVIRQEDGFTYVVMPTEIV